MVVRKPEEPFMVLQREFALFDHLSLLFPELHQLVNNIFNIKHVSQPVEITVANQKRNCFSSRET